MNEAEKKQIILMARQGFNDKQIADAVYYSRSYVSRTLCKLGILRKPGKRCKLPKERIAMICEMHRDGIGYQEIAKQMNMKRQTVYALIKRETKNEHICKKRRSEGGN